MTLRIALTGSSGMLGRTLVRRLSGHAVTVIDRKAVSLDRLRPTIDAWRTIMPDVTIHCAAMTAVDACETQQDAAFIANALVPANIASACQHSGSRMIAISTDYVFAGLLSRPYHEWDETGPRTIYGQSKLAGELAVRNHCADHTILRTSWLYGPGGPSFYHTILRLASLAESAPLQVVSDQIGNPTSTDALADCIIRLLHDPVLGIVHASCEGETSWHGFAEEIIARRSLRRPLVACTTAEYPRPAPRPANSRLEKRVLRLSGHPSFLHWKDAFEQFLKDFPDG